MAPSIDWPNAVISIPQSDLTAIGGDVYVLDTDTFRLALRDAEDSASGMAWTKTHDHNTEVTFAGTTFARQVIILVPWQVEFEDTGAAYTVRIEGSNNNLLDGNVLIPTPLVSYVSTNSAGLIVRESGTSGLTPGESTTLTRIDQFMRSGRTQTDDGSGDLIVETPDGDTYTTTGYEDADGTTPQSGGRMLKHDPLPDTPDP